MEHVTIVFHPSRWAPRTCKQSEILVGRGQCLTDERNAELAVVVDVERPQVFIPFGDVRIHIARKVAAVNVRTAKRITDAERRIEIRLQHFPLAGWWELKKCFSGGISEGASNSQNSLEGFAGINKYYCSPFGRLVQIGPLQCRRLIEETRSTFGRKINRSGVVRTTVFCQECQD